MISGGSSGDWSDLPTDVHQDIMSHLEVADFVRFKTTSNSCRSTSLIKNCRPKRHQIPWMMLSTTDRPQFRFFYSLTEQKIYKFYLPQIAGDYVVGSSEGFLITVDRFADLHTLNPLTGAELFPLPPTVTQAGLREMVRNSAGEITHYVRDDMVPNRAGEELDLAYMRKFYRKVVITPSLDAVVAVIHGGKYDILAFARAGDTSWTLINPLSVYLGHTEDIIFHKGCMHVVTIVGDLFILDLKTYSEKPMKLCPLIINPYHADCDSFRRYLVESPDGNDLYFLVKVLDEDRIPRITTTIRVSKLVNHQWVEIKDIGDIAIFVGLNYSKAYSTRDFVHLKKNTIYFTYDDTFIYLSYAIEDKPKKYRKNGDSGVFNMEDGSIQLLTPKELQHIWPPPVWFNPVLRR